MLDDWRRRDAKGAEIETILAVDWLEADLMMRQLARFLTDSLLHPNGQPLLHICLSGAMNDYENSRLKGEADPQRLIVFASSMLTMAKGVCHYRVTALQQTWVPHSGEPLLDWILLRGGTMTVVHHPWETTTLTWKTTAKWVLSRHLRDLLEQAEEVVWLNR